MAEKIVEIVFLIFICIALYNFGLYVLGPVIEKILLFNYLRGQHHAFQHMASLAKHENNTACHQ